KRPTATTSGSWQPPAATGKEGDSYTVTLDLAADQDPEVEIKVRPQSDASIGGKQPFRGKLKLLPTVDLGDVGPPSNYSFLGGQLLTVIKKEILTDAGGDYASIRVKANRNCALKEGPFRDRKTAKIWVEVKADIGRGGSAGIRGETTVKLELNEWKLSFDKRVGMWRDQQDVNLSALPDCDRKCLAEIGRNGGTIDLIVDGGIKLADFTLWNEARFKDATLLLWGAGQTQMKANYVDAEDVYRFEVAGKLGPAQGPKTSVRLEVWVEEALRNRMNKLLKVMRELQNEVGGELEADAEKFIQKCIEILAGEDASQLGARDQKFKQATYAAVFFGEYSLQTVKGFKLTLNLHNSIYERYMQNLVAFVMELVFMFGEDFFKKVFGRVLKHGKEEAEKVIKSEARTIAHEAVDEAQAALKPKAEAAHAAVEQLKQSRRSLIESSGSAIRKSEELVEAIAKQQLEQAEKTQAKEAAEQGAEQLTRQIDSLKRTGLPDDLGTVTRHLDEITKQLEKNSEQLATAMRNAEMLQTSLSHSPTGPRQMVEAMEASLKKAQAEVKRLQGIAEGLTAKEGPLQSMSQAISGLKTKKGEASKLAEQLTELERKLIASNRDLQANDAVVEAQVKQFVKGLQEQSAKEAELAAFRAQEKMLADITQRAAHGTEAEFKEAVEAAMRNMPVEEQIRLSVVRSMNAEGGVEEVTRVLKAWESSLSRMPAGASAEVRAQVEKGLGTVRAALHDIGMVHETNKTAVEQAFGWAADYIKGKFNERAMKIRELLLQLAHSDYKAVPAKYYDDTYWGQACAWVDGLLEGAAGWWNWFWSFVPAGTQWAETASKSKDWGPYLAGKTILYMAEFSFGALTFLMILVDQILQLIMKVLEAVLYIANSPNFAKYRLTEEAAKNAVNAPRGMPARLPDEFFAFSNKMVTAVAERVDPKRLVNETGGKAAMTNSIKQEFAGAYREYYEPQWTRASTFVAKLAGADGALDPGMLDSDEVRAEQRKATEVLANILKPMEQYQVSFAKGDRTGTLTTDLVGLKDDYFKGEWTPHDLDVLFEKICDALSLLIKFTGFGLLIGGLLLGAVPIVAAGGAVMAAGGVSDMFWAIMRNVVNALRCMPDVLGAQFEVMKVHSLAYQEIYRQLDLTDVIRSEEIPDWIKERGGPFGIYG
ncbi:MAG TPA: hypothetical protein VJ719_08690, partial [Chthoniobacterales bacterium]|nr:hypothetical protein [Chthoniobacterales bacterium]